MERLRLHVAASKGLRGERSRDVVQYYRWSADRGNADAQSAVGQVLNYGTHGVARDHSAAVKYLTAASDAGDADAAAHLGHMYASGRGAPRDLARAVELFRSASRRNHPSALYGLGVLHLTGEAADVATGLDKDADKAFKSLSQAAELGSPDAHFLMGVLHLKGLGVKRRSAQRALSYFSLAAHAGHSLAMYNAAAMQLAGKGQGTRSCKPAVALLKALCETGPAAAWLQAGHEAFFRGSQATALLMYLRAAEAGFELGQSNAAWMLDRGYGQEQAPQAQQQQQTAAAGSSPGGQAVAPSLPPALLLRVSLYRASADQGNVHSLLQLGDAYYYGRGVPRGRDVVRAAAIYYDAFTERSAEAMFNLGLCHQLGCGVPQDLDLARRYYLMAAGAQRDASLAVTLALTGLKAQLYWRRLKPWLPSPLLEAGARLLLAPASSAAATVLQQLGGALQAQSQVLLVSEVTLWRWLDVSGLTRLAAAVARWEMGEAATLLGLAGVLWLVLRMRRQRAAQQFARQQQQQGGAAEGPAQRAGRRGRAAAGIANRARAAAQPDGGGAGSPRRASGEVVVDDADDAGGLDLIGVQDLE